MATRFALPLSATVWAAKSHLVEYAAAHSGIQNFGLLTEPGDRYIDQWRVKKRSQPPTVAPFSTALRISVFAQQV